MSAPLRAGIIGGGFMARVHARAIRAAGHEVVGVVTSTPERSRVSAAELGVGRSFRSADELIAAAEVDVVHVCTPNDLHVALSTAAIAAGKAVVCEKPLATTLADASSLLGAAQESGTATAVPFVYRYYPAIREIRARIEAGEAGELLLLHGSYLQDWLAASASNNWRVDSARGGASRAFADIGVHWCDLMEFVTGHRIVRLAADTATSFQRRGIPDSWVPVGTEDVATVLFETDRGARGSLTVSQVSLGRKNRLWFSFDGTKASYEFNQEAPDALWIGGHGENRIIASGTAGMASPDARRLAVLPPGHPMGYQDAFNAFMQHAYESFGGRAVVDLPSFVEGHRAAVLTEAVMSSAESRTWVEVARAFVG